VIIEGSILRERFNAEFGEIKHFKPIYHASAFSLPFLPVVTNQAPGKIQLFQWGLIPGWVKDEGSAEQIRLHTLNARAETIRSRSAFRPLIKKKRCLILVDGFYEWREVNRQKYPYYIFLKERDPFALAGIWDTWINMKTHEIHSTFSVITTQANTLLSKIHNTTKRMPVVLTLKQEKEWLRNDVSPQTIDSLLHPREDPRLTAHPITKLITTRGANKNTPEVMREHHYKELEETTTEPAGRK